LKRIGILTAGGDTPALNATIKGTVVRANQCRVEIFGFIKGFSGLLSPEVPHVHLNPLFTEIPELDATHGGTILGASRAFVDPGDTRRLEEVADRIKKLSIDGLICIGGDGTLNGLQPLAERFPIVLAPKTIDNDLGLNYRSEPDEWQRETTPGGIRYKQTPSRTTFDIENMINYVTPGYATSVFVSAEGVRRIRTTAESHRRIAIVEVMGRNSGYIALGSSPSTR
jgi:6-phosphofructokinase 1